MTSFTILLSGIYLLNIGFKNRPHGIATLPSQVQHILESMRAVTPKQISKGYYDNVQQQLY